MKSPGRRLLRAALYGVGLLLVVAVLLVGWRMLSIRGQRSAYDKRLADIAAKGQVVDIAV